ncbi:hypothetical protein AXG93_2816s1000 [Marchantia polymorpha subsp. ruderalis]|uniref:Uncharacterized protein n=1 Tax=Marchantia polymorpha subsp. ruderalis TaxID=1480154 RepID=A0A176W916_MARPO|nr:hypothetical protein AXG93_2816s1000 [Marchantia polymorpha subsp. ruderalis]
MPRSEGARSIGAHFASDLRELAAHFSPAFLVAEDDIVFSGAVEQQLGFQDGLFAEVGEGRQACVRRDHAEVRVNDFSVPSAAAGVTFEELLRGDRHA